jgi:hypothetical protein
VRLMALQALSKAIRGSSRAQLYRWARQGLIPVVRIGRRVFVEEGALAAFVARGGKALSADRRKARRGAAEGENWSGQGQVPRTQMRVKNVRD